LKGLEHLTSESSNIAYLLSRCSTLPHLQTLAASIKNSASSLLPTILPLPVLHDLKLSGPLEQCALFLNSLPSVQLKTLSVKFSDLSPQLEDLTNIVTNISATSLLHLCLLPLSELEEVVINHLDSYLPPLYQCHRLVNVNLGSADPLVDLKDSDLRAMAEAWPCLESLVLPVIGPPDESPKTTFEGLSWLAALCPSLTRLELVIDAFGVDVQRVVSVSKLERLHLGSSWIDDTDISRVAHCISYLFPVLPYFDVYRDSDMSGLGWSCELSSRDVAWAEVQRLVGRSEGFPLSVL
jgi:hypothetical protein